MSRLILFMVILFVTSCGNSDEEVLCYSFDLKSCAGDPWLSDNTNNNEATLTSLTITYFAEQGIEVKQIIIDMAFHEVVCLACNVCPQGSRVFLEISAQDSSALSELSLLNVEIAHCPIIN